MATHSSVLAWRIPGMGEPGGLSSLGSQESDTTEATVEAAAARSLLILTGSKSVEINKKLNDCVNSQTALFSQI